MHLCAGLAAVALLLTGCASTGAPRPPSLMLPQVVRGMQAERFGSYVDLRWAVPTLTTDRLPLTAKKHGAGPLTAELCRVEAKNCTVFARQIVTPGEAAVTQDRLSAELASGPARPLVYRVRLRNGAGRDAGWSRDTVTAAGQAPPPIEGLTAITTDRGMQLTWQKAAPFAGDRILLRASQTNLPGAQERELAAPAGAGGVIDPAPKPGDVERYSVVRTRMVLIDGAEVALHGEPGTIETTMRKDTFPPARPTGLIAVAVQMEGAPAEIDLSWEPDTEPDMLGYLVYRVDTGAAAAPEQPRQITPTPVDAVSFRDADVVSGHGYRYTVVAVDRSGNRSAPSAPADEHLH